MEWSDVLMVEYHLDDLSQADVIAEAAEADVGIVVKKGLASGFLDPEPAIQLVLGTPGVGSLVVGSLTLEHLEQNVRVAAKVL
jgi:aryl-alcohol dehydrogenase-like predicted oxidoreductase